ncbi:hypothetical protein HUJ05_006811 [Dendroctonus ponderosae]|nr:hypothetical protein HUJ05_006810 [Dendroctonus ponderosae]KAH0999199.1 hypothetical protein HUJ05_006811 [Dendroctonus ponderosae]
MAFHCSPAGFWIINVAIMLPSQHQSTADSRPIWMSCATDPYRPTKEQNGQTPIVPNNKINEKTLKFGNCLLALGSFNAFSVHGVQTASNDPNVYPIKKKYIVQSRLPTHKAGTSFKVFLFAICACMGLVCSLTRITDRRHHWWDVLTGTIIALFGAAYTIRVLHAQVIILHRRIISDQMNFGEDGMKETCETCIV